MGVTRAESAGGGDTETQIALDTFSGLRVPALSRAGTRSGRRIDHFEGLNGPLTLKCLYGIMDARGQL
jgi:hypothetical protein